MSGSNTSFAPFSPTDLSNLSAATNIFLYGYLIIMCIGFVGNLCQILTFSRKTMRNVSTGVLFLALSISDTLYLLLSTYVLIIYGFKLSDKSDLAVTCRLRHFSSYFTTNFSAWMLTMSNTSAVKVYLVIFSLTCFFSLWWSVDPHAIPSQSPRFLYSSYSYLFDHRRFNPRFPSAYSSAHATVWFRHSWWYRYLWSESVLPIVCFLLHGILAGHYHCHSEYSSSRFDALFPGGDHCQHSDTSKSRRSHSAEQPRFARETPFTLYSPANVHSHGCHVDSLLRHHTSRGRVPIHRVNIRCPAALHPQSSLGRCVRLNHSIELCPQLLSAQSNIEVVSQRIHTGHAVLDLDSIQGFEEQYLGRYGHPTESQA